MKIRTLHALVNSSTNSQTGGKKPSSSLRRGISLVLIALLITGCSKAVEIPRDEIGKPAYHEPGKYRIRLKNENEYVARRFSVSDSTLVIEELSGDGELYGYSQLALPMKIALSDVESVAELKTDKGLIIGAVATVCILAGLFLWKARGHSDTSD